MTFVCLWSPAWRTGADASLALATTLLTRAPRVLVGEGASGSAGERVIWADARGLPAPGLARDLVALVHDDGVKDVCAGVASTPIAAEFAAVEGNPGVNVVELGNDRAYIGLFPITALPLSRSPRISPLLFGIGVNTCAEFAALTQESVEVRLGAEAVALWRLARADDDRASTLFAPIPRELPHATLDWVDYEVTDPARLLFVINALLESVCDTLAQDGRGARELSIDFMLSNRSTQSQALRASRATASRQAWVRLVRSALERLTLPCAVTGIAVRATRVSGREAAQADLFDRGLSSAAATEDAIARLIEDQGEVVVRPDNSLHPRIDTRTTWRAAERRTANSELQTANSSTVTALTLQLAASPQPIVVETIARRDHFAPARYRDGVYGTKWHEIVHVAGPDRISGGKYDSAQAYAREYFRCVTREGALVWLFRDAQATRNSWFLHGWWD